MVYNLSVRRIIDTARTLNLLNRSFFFLSSRAYKLLTKFGVGLGRTQVIVLG